MVSTSSIAQRAAEWVGMHDKPRTSVPVSDKKVLLIVPQGKRTFVLVYSEEYGRPEGAHFFLTERRAERVIDALEGWLV